MASTGTYADALDNADFIEEAFERVLIDPATLTSRHWNSALRSAKLLFAYWATKGVRLFQVDEQTKDMVDGTPSYALATGTIAFLGGFIRRSSVDTPVFPINRDQYAAIPDKTSEGLPTQAWYDRATNTIYPWQVPENSTDVLYYRRIRRVQDFGTAANTPDLPIWWWEALTSGMTWRLAEKFAPQLFDAKAALAEAMLSAALLEDRERGDASMDIAVI